MFYCKICKGQVVLDGGKCPGCHTDYSEELASERKQSNEVEETNYEEQKAINVEQIINNISRDKIDANISFFITWGVVLKVILFIVSFACMVLSFVLIDSTDSLSLLLLIPMVSSILMAFIVDNQLKWKSYLLYSVSRNVKK